MKNFNEKYTIRDFIDKNKWSNVYEGINNDTNEKIILNILINIEGKEENLEKFKEEVNLLKDMDDTNLTKVSNILTYMNKEKTYYYLESEYFEGLTLKELKECTQLDESKSLEIIREVIKGIREFDYKGFNYGDLTEENIIINEKGIVKVNVLSFINNHEGHLNCKSINNKNCDSSKDINNIGKILCKLITNKEYFNPKEHIENIDIDLVEILMKSTNTKYISKNKYKDLDEFLHDVTSYLNYGYINKNEVTNDEGAYYEEHDFNLKKYIVPILASVVLLGGISVGSKYILDNMNKNQPTTYVSNENKTETQNKDNNENANKNDTTVSNDNSEQSTKTVSNNSSENTESITKENTSEPKTKTESTTKKEENTYKSNKVNKSEEQNNSNKNQTGKHDNQKDDDEDNNNSKPINPTNNPTNNGEGNNNGEGSNTDNQDKNDGKDNNTDNQDKNDGEDNNTDNENKNDENQQQSQQSNKQEKNNSNKNNSNVTQNIQNKSNEE